MPVAGGEPGVSRRVATRHSPPPLSSAASATPRDASVCADRLRAFRCVTKATSRFWTIAAAWRFWRPETRLWLGTRLDPNDRLMESPTRIFHFRGVAILPSGPEKTLQSVTFAPRNHVHMQMRHRLADAVVHGHEGALGAEPVLHRRRQDLRVGEELAGKGFGQVPKGLEMGLRNQQAVARKERAVVQEGERDRVLKYHRRGEFTGGDAAKKAGGEHAFLSCIMGAPQVRQTDSQSAAG